MLDRGVDLRAVQTFIPDFLKDLLVDAFLRDLGVGRGDLALVRPTWMPAILTEGLFMMVPDQEAALRSAEGRHLYALGVFSGIQDFLRTRAEGR